MIEYEFEDKKGRRHFRLYDAGKAPSIGKTITVKIDGQPVALTRVFSKARLQVPNYAHVAHSLPRRGEPGDLGAPFYDENDKPCFSTRAQVKEREAKEAGLRKWG